MLRRPTSTSSTLTSVAGFGALDFKGKIGDAHHLAAVDIDDLLIEQVARDAQHIFVVVIGNELFIAERDAIAERQWSGPDRSGR